LKTIIIACTCIGKGFVLLCKSRVYVSDTKEKWCALLEQHGNGVRGGYLHEAANLDCNLLSEEAIMPIPATAELEITAGHRTFSDRVAYSGGTKGLEGPM
jgi:hypothetical protein